MFYNTWPTYVQPETILVYTDMRFMK